MCTPERARSQAACTRGNKGNESKAEMTGTSTAAESFRASGIANNKTNRDFEKTRVKSLC